MTAYTDGDWWVGGFILDEEDQRVFRLIEKVDKETEDPAQRMNYWREDGGIDVTHVKLIEIRVMHVAPQGWVTTDHRPIITEDDTHVMGQCQCGYGLGGLAYAGSTRYTLQEARVAMHRTHDTHLTMEVPNLRCARCGERSHSIEYCERDA